MEDKYTKSLNKKPDLVYNTIAHQSKTNGGLSAAEWNFVINSLRNQTNITAKNLERLYRWLIHDWDHNTEGVVVFETETQEHGFVDYIKNTIDLLHIAHDVISQAVANNASAISSETLSRQSADNALDGRIDVLEAFKYNLDTDITDEIAQAVNAEKTAREEADTVLDNKKVDKVADKSLIADTEIARLALVDNYDDRGITQALSTHMSGTVKHVTQADKNKWNALENYDDTALSGRVTTIETALPSKANLVGGKVPDSELPSYSTPTEVDNKIASAIASTYIPKGSLANITGLPTLQASNKGFVYNIASAFTTTTDFIEGAGNTYPAGTNIVIVEASIGVYKWDVLAGFVDLSSYALNTDILALGTTSDDAYRGDLGQTAYDHSQSAHAPTDAVTIWRYQ